MQIDGNWWNLLKAAIATVEMTTTAMAVPLIWTDVRLDDDFWCDKLPNFSNESSLALSSNSWNSDRRTESNFFDIFTICINCQAVKYEPSSWAREKFKKTHKVKK